MEYNNETYISIHYNKEDFLRLRLSANSEENWENAIDIFNDRIKGRYLNVVKKLIEEDNIIIDGFSIMALDCLLIETLLQFKNGWDVTKNGNRTQYTKFLKEEFSQIFISDDLADKFYGDIRCGILHSAQTYRKSKLTFDVDYIVKLNVINEEVHINVNVKKFTEAILNIIINILHS